MAHPLTKRVS